MNIYIKVKNIAKLKDVFAYEQFATTADTAEELIREMVALNVKRFNKSRNTEDLMLLSEETIANTARSGKVSFGGKKDNKRKVDVEVMQNEAIFQFQNSRFKIINETQKREYTQLSENLNLKENDCLVLMKLAMLEGRRF